MGVLENRVALVTGSSRGIGAAIATLFAREGARVAVHGRDEAALGAVRAAIEREGGTTMTVTGDVTKFSDIEALRARIEAAWEPVDILIANAGASLTKPGPLEETSEEGWHACVDANLTATFLTLKSFLPGMKQRGHGTIVTVSSAAARRAHPQSPIPYAAAKAGIQMLTQHVATQVGPFGIRINCLAPEIILTEGNNERIPDAQKAALVEAHPIKRLGTPNDVARAALFLASDQSAWITGAVVDVSGGAVMV
jgi:3-oxoacyl-[acyl-carrier protein] reductase